MDGTTNTAGGTSVFFNYSSTQNACEQIQSISKDLSEKIEQIRQIYKDKDSIWQGEAAGRFWEYYLATGKEYYIDEIDKIANESIPKAVNAVLGLVEQNKATDANLMSETFTEAQANDNVQGNETTTDATGVNTTLNDSVGANDSVQGNETTTGATGVNTTIIDDVHTNDNFTSIDSLTTNATGVNTTGIDNVHTSGAFSGTSSTDSGVKTETGSIDEMISNKNAGNN